MVKTPGWFHFSAAAVARAQTAGVSLLVSKTGLPFCVETTASMPARAPPLNALLGHLVPPLALWVGQKRGIPSSNLIGDAHVLGMVGDGDPIERPVLFEAHAVVHDDFPAGGRFEQVIGGQRRPEHSGVEREGGVDVGNAPVDAVGDCLARVGGIIGLLRFDLAWSILGCGEGSCSRRPTL